MEPKEFLISYLNNDSPVGYEQSGQQIWIDYIKPYVNEVKIDTYGNVIGRLLSNNRSNFQVLLGAHSDEVSWMVASINDKGYIYVVNNGGADAQITPSTRVNIYGDNGIVRGVVGWPAIHVRDDDTLTAAQKNICIDIGANTKEEVELLGVHIGNVITLDGQCEELVNGYLVGKAFDNKVGGFILAEVAQKLNENNVSLPFDVCFLNAVQEEIGSGGARIVAQNLKPDLAIIIDATHDVKSPLYEQCDDITKMMDVECGKGPVLLYGAPIQNNFQKVITNTAKVNDIKFQREACTGRSGTDTDAFAYYGKSAASVLVSVPLKYMHTTVEMVNYSDIENTIKLLYHTILNIHPYENYNYLKF